MIQKFLTKFYKTFKKRRIIKRKDIILFNRGYYGYKNYQIGINKYKIIPTIFPKQSYSEEKLKGQMSYPMEVFSRNKKAKNLKKDIDSIASILYKELQNWKDLKPIRGNNRRFFQSSKRCIRIRWIPQLHSRIHEQKNLFMLIINSTNRTTRI